MAFIKMLLSIVMGWIGALLLCLSAIAIMIAPREPFSYVVGIVIAFVGVLLMRPLIHRRRNGTISWSTLKAQFSELRTNVVELSSQAKTTADALAAKAQTSMAVAKENKERLEREAAACKAKTAAFRESLRDQCQHEPVPVTVMGGSGMNLQPKESLLLGCGDLSLHLHNPSSFSETAIPFSSITAIEISGPGTESSNAGIAGGGFGLQGAATGIAVAALINAVTTINKTNTFLRVATETSEILLHTASVDPSALRLLLSRAFVQLDATKNHRSQGGVSLSLELDRLHALLEKGALTDEEFRAAKTRLLAMPTEP